MNANGREFSAQCEIRKHSRSFAVEIPRADLEPSSISATKSRIVMVNTLQLTRTAELLLGAFRIDTDSPMSILAISQSRYFS